MNPLNLKQLLLTFFCLLFTKALFSQKNSEKGDRYFDQNLFETAIKYYEMDIHSKDKKVSEYALKKLANCYRICGEFEKAEETFKKILRKKKKDPLNYLNYGLALKNSAKFAEAKEQLQEYVKLAPDDPIGLVFLLSCDSAQLWLDQTIGKEVKNLQEINTAASEFSPVLLNTNKLYFSSSREGSKKTLISLDGGNEAEKLDLYSVKLTDIQTQKNKNLTPTNFSEINTALHEGSACFSQDGQYLYFTKTVKGKKNTEKNEILGTLQLFVSKKDSLGIWSSPKSAFRFNSLSYSIGHPSLSQDGNTLFYMSDKPGGYGKTDIYYSIKQKDGTWTEPINAGKEVNTFGHELFPTLAPNGTLYFSSNAHPGMGQLDIFESTCINGVWTKVQNLKPPINSIANDFGIVVDENNDHGIFSSDRFNGKGAEDLYSFSNESPIILQLNNDTLSIQDLSLFDDVIYTIHNESDSSDVIWQESNSSLMAVLEKNKTYKLKATKYGMKYNEIRLSVNENKIDSLSSICVESQNREIQIKGHITKPLIPSLLNKPFASSNPSIPSPNTPEAYQELTLHKNGSFSFKVNINPGNSGRLCFSSPSAEPLLEN